MFYRTILLVVLLPLLFVNVVPVNAQPCADTQPSIVGPQVVSNNQPGVIYSTPNIPGHTYFWTVAGGVITSGQNTSQITVLWGAVGMGSVSVTETNPAAGCNATDNMAVSIRPLLVSYFYYTNTSCYGDDLSFFDASVADPAFPIVTWDWDFGDGFTSVLQNPTHLYLPPYNITWTVTLIVTNSAGDKDTIYDAVYVNPNQFIPTAAFTATVPNCTYDPVSFNSTASTTPPGTGNIINWDWNFDDPASGPNNIVSGSTPAAQNPTHVFTAPGAYDVQLIITNERYCKDTLVQTVVIQPSVPTAQFTYTSPTCQNNPIFFTDLSFFPPGRDIVMWEWNFGDGTAPVIVLAPNNPNQSHIFPGLGPYNVLLIVTNNVGCLDSMYQSVALTPSPLADFTWDINCATDTIHFTNLSETNMGPPIASYSWNFGDPASGNNTSTAKDPTHVYANPGIYSVMLVTRNTAGCPDTTFKSITIFAKPAVEFTWNVGSQNNEIQFHVDSTITDLGAIGYMMQWNFGDGTYGYGHNPTHIYAGAGTFTVILEVMDTNGCSNTAQHDIIVPSMPMAFFSSTSPVCLGDPMCFTDLSSVPTPPFGWITQWVWNYGDGSPNDTIFFPNNPNVCHTYTTAGTFLVTLTVWDNWGYYDSYSDNQDVLLVPIANFYYSSACEDQIVQFTDASFPNGGGNIIVWDWNFDDPISGINNTSNLQNPTHIFQGGNATYNVRLVVTNFNNCRDTIIKPVYVFPHPPVDFTHDTACVNQYVTFTADTVITFVDSITTWLWTFGDGSPSTNDPVTTAHLYASPGTYIATLTVVDVNGCENTVSHEVRVNPLPIPEFSWLAPTCQGSPVQFTDQSYVPAGYTGYIAKWVWDFGDGTTQTVILPGSPNVIHTFVGPGITHLVRLTVWTNDSCSDYIEHTVVSIPAPIANFDYSPVRCVNQSIQFTDLSQTNGGGSLTVWNWNFDDPGSGINNISTLQNPTHTFATAGSYQVRLIVQNVSGCADTIIKTVDINALPAPDFAADTACFGTPTQFTDLTIPNAPSIIVYNWDFGDGTPPSPLQNPAHTYATYGYFTVTLTVTNSNGCVNSISKQVLVNPLPIAEFSFSTPNCFGAVVNFTNLSSTVPGYLGSIVNWTWDFGDGTTTVVWFPGNPNVSHTFVGPALSHTVRLTVKTSDSCESWVEHIVTSIPSPVANFTYSGTSCADQVVQFTDLSQENGGGSIIFWYWNFDDPGSGSNNTSNAQNPLHVFTAPGTYDVMLIITNTSNCTDTIIQPVNVNLLPVANFTADTACLGNPTNFVDGSTPNAAGMSSWLWDFGDGTPTSGQQNPSHIYANYGYYTVTLTVVNTNGCVHTTSKQVMVRPLPIPEFSYSTPNCVGAVVQFTDLSTTVPGYLGPIQTWLWDFGDGTTTTVTWPANPNVSHTFVGGATSHTVRLTVTTVNGCTAFIEHIVNSIPSPLANFSFPNNNCADQAVQFTDISQPNGGGNIISWLWNFDDPPSGINNTSTAQNPIHYFTAPGTYDVVLIIANTSGCTDTVTYPVTVVALPVANFTADTACLGALTSFTDLSTSSAGTIASHLWDFGDGQTSTASNPTHLYGSAGTYNVKLTVTTTFGCIKDTTKAVQVLGAAVAAFSATTPTCAGDSVQFTDLSSTPNGSIIQWVWNFGDGNTVTINYPASPNVRHLYASGGTYNVTLTITTSLGCTASKTNPVVVEPAPLANFDYASTRCEQMPVQFTDLTQPNGGSAIASWLWNFGDPASGSANTSNIQNPTHSFSTSGTFTVLLTVTNANGCHDSISKSVSVNQAPVAQFTADTACLGLPTSFTDQSTPNATSIIAWNWNFGDPSSGTNNTSTAQNPTHVFTSTGLFLVTLSVTNSNSCVDDTVIEINVNPAPDAMFSADASCVNTPTQFTDLSIAPGSAIVAWFWDFGDGTGTSTEQNPTYTYTAPGTYDVKLVVTNLSNCQDSIIIPVISRPTPIAAFTYVNFFCPAGQVNFQDQSQGVGAAIVDHLWIFEPGSTSNGVNPQYTYSITDTTYLVTLIVTDNYGCKDTIVDSVYVKPGFSFTFNNDTVCHGYPTHFQAVNLADGDSLYSPFWDFGDPASGPNNFSYQYNPQHTFTQPGSYVVKLRVVNSDNCVDSIYRYVSVFALPEPDFSFISTPCDSIIHFRDLTLAGGGTIITWEWFFGDGTPPVVITGPGTGDTSHLYTAVGTYNVTLVTTNSNGCVDSLTKVVELYPCIKATFTHDDTLLCARYNIAFSDSSLPVSIINEWHWFWGDGQDTLYTVHAPVVTHRYADAGTYNVDLVIRALVNSTTFRDTARQQIVIHPTPLTLFSNTGVCMEQITLFSDTSTTFGEPISTWSWTFGEPTSGTADTSTFRNPGHQYDTAGIYDVKLIVMNKYGCKDSLTKPTRVYGLPVAQFSSSIGCNGNPTYFYDGSQTADTLMAQWLWNFGDPNSQLDISDQENPIYIYRSEGQYLVTMIVEDYFGCRDTVDSTITVHLTPTSSFTITENINGMIGKIELNNISVGADAYYWDFGNGQTSEEINPIVTYSEDGTYIIMLISTNQYECSDTTFYSYEVLFKGLYIPNAFAPTSTNYAVKNFQPVGVGLKLYNIQVFDIWGNLVWESNKLDSQGRPTEGWNGKVNGVMCPSGTYMWKASATFVDDTIWEGSDIGKGEAKTIGTVTLIR